MSDYVFSALIVCVAILVVAILFYASGVFDVSTVDDLQAVHGIGTF
jgi:hypothetical protein